MYLDNCNIHKQHIIDRFEPAQCVEQFFSTAEVEQLTLLQFRLASRVKWTSTSNNIQPICDIDSLITLVPWFRERMMEQIGKFSDHHTGNYYITTQLHDAHVDLLTEVECNEYPWTASVVPYKSCVIPLLITEGADAYTAFFNQRHTGNSITLDRASISSQENSDYTISRSYPEFTNYGDTIEHNYIFPQIPEENLDGLSVETVLPFKPGNIMIFDACQIHASCVSKNRPNYRWLKSGINIQFYKEI